MNDVNVFKNVSELKIDPEMTVSELLQKLKLVTSSDSEEVFVHFVSTTYNLKKNLIYVAIKVLIHVEFFLNNAWLFLIWN